MDDSAPALAELVIGRQRAKGARMAPLANTVEEPGCHTGGNRRAPEPLPRRRGHGARIAERPRQVQPHPSPVTPGTAEATMAPDVPA